MSEEQWQPARLIPTSGISGPDEQETRATSALLAVLPVVREFGLGLFRPFGAPAGNMQSFIEVPLELADGRTIRPDGLVQITRGQRSWTALIEVKTGTNDLGRDQIENYLDVARDNGFDAVVTISIQLAPSVGVHPVEVDKRKLRRVALHHLSWAEIVSAAVIQRVHSGVDDPEQAWILAELIRYLQHPRSGAVDFSDMGGAWVTVREAITAGTLRSNDKGLAEVVSRWDQLLRFAALRLERELGSGVQVVLSRKETADAGLRAADLAAALVSQGVLVGVIRVPNTAGDLVIEADLRTNRCTVSVDIAAPTDGRPQTRVNWIVRQLSDAPPALRIDAFAHMARTSTSELLSVVRADPATLLPDSRVDLRRFRISAVSQLGSKRGVGRGSFIDSILGALDGFYESVLQGLRPWAPKAPQLSRSGSVLADAGIDTAALPSEAVSVVLNDAISPTDRVVVGVSPGYSASSGEQHEVAPDLGTDDSELVSWAAQEAEVNDQRADSIGFTSSDERAFGDEIHANDRASTEAGAAVDGHAGDDHRHPDSGMQATAEQADT